MTSMDYFRLIEKNLIIENEKVRLEEESFLIRSQSKPVFEVVEQELIIAKGCIWKLQLELQESKKNLLAKTNNGSFNNTATNATQSIDIESSSNSNYISDEDEANLAPNL